MKIDAFTAGVVLMVAAAIGGLVFSVNKLQRNTEICNSIKGIMVETPNGYHCLTKKDFE